MSSISYRIRDGYGEWSEVRCDGEGLSIIFPADINGHLTIGGLCHEVKNGICRIDIDTLPDGEYVPMLYTSEMTAKLEPMIVRGKTVGTAATSESTVRRALARIAALEIDKELAEERLAALEAACMNTSILEL